MSAYTDYLRDAADHYGDDPSKWPPHTLANIKALQEAEFDTAPETAAEAEARLKREHLADEPEKASPTSGGNGGFGDGSTWGTGSGTYGGGGGPIDTTGVKDNRVHATQTSRVDNELYPGDWGVTAGGGAGTVGGNLDPKQRVADYGDFIAGGGTADGWDFQNGVPLPVKQAGPTFTKDPKTTSTVVGGVGQPKNTSEISSTTILDRGTKPDGTPYSEADWNWFITHGGVDDGDGRISAAENATYQGVNNVDITTTPGQDGVLTTNSTDVYGPDGSLIGDGSQLPDDIVIGDDDNLITDIGTPQGDVDPSANGEVPAGTAVGGETNNTGTTTTTTPGGDGEGGVDVDITTLPGGGSDGDDTNDDGGDDMGVFDGLQWPNINIDLRDGGIPGGTPPYFPGDIMGGTSTNTNTNTGGDQSLVNKIGELFGNVNATTGAMTNTAGDMTNTIGDQTATVGDLSTGPSTSSVGDLVTGASTSNVGDFDFGNMMGDIGNTTIKMMGDEKTAEAYANANAANLAAQETWRDEDILRLDPYNQAGISNIEGLKTAANANIEDQDFFKNQQGIDPVTKQEIGPTNQYNINPNTNIVPGQLGGPATPLMDQPANELTQTQNTSQGMPQSGSQAAGYDVAKWDALPAEEKAKYQAAGGAPGQLGGAMPQAREVGVNQINPFDSEDQGLRFLQDEMERSTRAQAAAGGKSNSGGTLAALQDRSAGIAAARAGDLANIGATQDRSSLASDAQRFGQGTVNQQAGFGQGMDQANFALGQEQSNIANQLNVNDQRYGQAMGTAAFGLGQDQANIANQFGMNDQLFNQLYNTGQFKQGQNMDAYNKLMGVVGNIGLNAATGQAQRGNTFANTATNTLEDQANAAGMAANNKYDSLSNLFGGFF